MKEDVIKVQQLCCKSGQKYLLNQIDWTVKKGQQWVIFGMNGSGKTTLLSIIAGYRNCTQGTVELFGETVTSQNILKLRKRIGWVSSSFFDRYYKNESALEIILAAKTGTLGLDFSIAEHDIQEAKQLLRYFHLEEKCNMPFYTLSKGERQTILLARALFTKPDILILDEPCSGLDVLAREKVFQLVRRLIEERKTTIIYVTHYAEEILDVFTDIMFLKRGKSFLQGALEEQFTANNLSAFLEQPVSFVQDEQRRLHLHFETAINCRRWEL